MSQKAAIAKIVTNLPPTIANFSAALYDGELLRLQGA
jgi:hypothetical protein